MDRAEILGAPGSLGRELESLGITAELYLVGGGAIAVAYDGRRATRDIDAVFVPTIEVYAAAARVAEREGRPAGLAERRGQGLPARP